MTGALTAVSFLTLALQASRHEVSAIDRQVEAWVQRTRPGPLEVPMRMLDFLGSGCVLLTLSFIAYVFLRRARHPVAKAVPAIAFGALVLQLLTKRLVARPRPNGEACGFPSGHTFGATIFLGFLLWLVWTSNLGRAWRWAGLLVAGLLVLGIAYCRLYWNVHWLTDVAGGFAGGLAYLTFVGIALGRRPP